MGLRSVWDVLIHGPNSQKLVSLDKRIANAINVMDGLNLRIDKLNKLTDEMADRLQSLMHQLTGGCSAEHAEDIKTKLAVEISKLQVMGKDPNNPLPDV